MSNRHIVLYHAHPSRSSSVVQLLEELGADYRIEPLRWDSGDHLKPEFLAINPLGKVPTIVHGSAVITEQVAIYLYLADLYAEAGLAPAIGDELRGPYLRWMAIYGSSFEPALVDRALKRDPGGRAMSPYGSFDAVWALLEQQLAAGPWLLGAKFCAVDVLWGNALGWMRKFGLLPDSERIDAYVAQVKARPAAQRALDKQPSA